MGLYDGIQVPISGQPASASLYGVAVRNAIIDLDARTSVVEQLTAQLPAPVKQGAPGAGTNSVTSTINTWSTIVTNSWTTTMTNPSSVFDMWCEVKLGAWLTSSTGSVRYSVALSGGLTTVETPNVTTIVGFGLMPEANNTGANSKQASGGFSLKIPAGAATVTFTPRAFRDTASTQAVNYPTIEITPIRFTLP